MGAGIGLIENMQCACEYAYPVMLPMVQEKCKKFSEHLWIMRSNPLRLKHAIRDDKIIN
jgi:hypothetical protein